MASMGLHDCFQFLVADCNSVHSAGKHDLIIVNQFFHHVGNIEMFCPLLKRSLHPSGALLTCDVAGRNGHMLWPSIDRHVQLAWNSLAEEKRHDRHFGSRQNRYVSIDHAAYSDEGVRAQDVVAGLSETFDFETFVTYGPR